MVTTISGSSGINTANVTSTDTITDVQGNVRVLDRNAIDSSTYALPSGSSGKYFSCYGSTNTFTIDSGNCVNGQIITIYNHLNTDITISWTNMINGVYIAGDTTNQGTSGSVTLAGKGLVTVLNDTLNRMILSGNVS